MVQSFKELTVYQKSYKTALDVYRMTEELPINERYGIQSQMRRAALGIPLNVAEGYGKKDSSAEFKRYLSIAIGSCNEMEVLFDFIKDLGYIDQEHHKEYQNRYEEIRKMLFGLREKWIEYERKKSGV